MPDPPGVQGSGELVATERGDTARLHAQLLAYARDLRSAIERSREATDALARAHVETVAALAAAVDFRDEVTGGHVYRVATYGTILAEQLAPDLRHDPQLVYGFLLHDIGKLAVPDTVLNKPGTLTGDEREQLRGHVEHGVTFIERVRFLRPALTIISTHHEAWDGTGYPRGLTGREIPLGARMFAVCDALDAMLHDRPYRRALGPDETLERLRDGAGTQFDPEVVEAVASELDRFLAVPPHPEVPPVELRTVPPSDAAEDLSRQVVDALDRPLLVISDRGEILEANAPLLERFGLAHVPVGIPLEDLLERTSLPLDDPTEAREALRQLRQDLFAGRRSGVMALATAEGRSHLRWTSEVLPGGGAAVAGRLVEFDELPASSSMGAELRDLADLADATERETPLPPERAGALRRRLARVRPLLDDLGDRAHATADEDASWETGG